MSDWQWCRIPSLVHVFPTPALPLLHISPALPLLHISPAISLLTKWHSPSISFLPTHSLPLVHLPPLSISVSRYDTSGDALTGPIPESFSKLKNLTSLDLANNNIGPLTDSISTIPNLEYLYLGGNNFTGSTIPSTITALTNLVVLGLEYTGVGGSIPSVLGLLTNLQTLRLDGNQLTGTLPATLGAPRLRTLQWHPMCGGAERQQPLLHRLWFEMPRTPSLPPLWPSPLPSPFSPACSDYDITVACPAKNTSCVVEQRDGSEFCTACAAFCSSCIQPAPGGYHFSGLSTGAIVGIVVGVLLFIVGTIAVVFIVIQCGKRSKEVEVEYTTQATGAYAGDNQYKSPQGAYAGYQPGAAGQV
ncbi:unnamed protein product [Closterium sp. NIES-64]|nr:unnamed protein product [Closterium sp. NIES-64]